MNELSKEEWDKIAKKYGLMNQKDWEEWLKNLKNLGKKKKE